MKRAKRRYKRDLYRFRETSIYSYDKMGMYLCVYYDITECYAITGIERTKCLNFFSDAKLGRSTYILQDSQFV